MENTNKHGKILMGPRIRITMWWGIRSMIAEFTPKIVECNKCGDKIHSRYSGEFVTCRCGAISVDQTDYYIRYIGEPQDFKKEDEQNRVD